MKWQKLFPWSRKPKVTVNTFSRGKPTDLQKKKAEKTEQLRSELPFIKRRVRVKAVSRPSSMVEG